MDNLARGTVSCESARSADGTGEPMRDIDGLRITWPNPFRSRDFGAKVAAGSDSYSPGLRGNTIMPASPDATGRDTGPASERPAGIDESAPPVLPGAGRAKGAAGLSVWVFAAAVGAGLLSWGFGEKVYRAFAPPANVQVNRYEFATLNRAQGIADQKNAALAFGAFGTLLGLLIGAAGGLSPRSVPAVAGAMLAGLLLGGAGGAGAAYELTPVFRQYYNDVNPSLLLPVVVRGGTCAAIGLATGLALGLGWGGGRSSILRAVAGGGCGGLLGIIVFEVLNGVLFPMERNDNIITSSGVTRLLCYLCAALGIALGAVVLGRSRARPAAVSSAQA
jgi:hypothetical protein